MYVLRCIVVIRYIRSVRLSKGDPQRPRVSPKGTSAYCDWRVAGRDPWMTVRSAWFWTPGVYVW